MSPTAIPILLYHSVDDDPPRDFGRYAVDRAMFSSHLDVIASEGREALRVSDLVDRLSRGAALPPRPVVITFDDGFADFAEAAWPALRRHSLPATLYVVSGELGGASRWLDSEGAGDRPMLSWDQVSALDADGCEIGAHTDSHPSLDCVDLDAARGEIVRSIDALGEGLGRRPRSFAYPHGHHDRDVRRLVVESGVDSACAVKNAMSHPADDRFALARITITRDVGPDRLVRILDGADVPRAGHSERIRTRAYRVVRRRRHRMMSRSRP